MNLLKVNGTSIGEPIIKYLNNNIWELRPLRDRILFAYWKNESFILLHIFMKDTQKTPIRELEQAKRNLLDFLKRSDKNE